MKAKLNAVSTEKIREYIYYMETKQAIPEASADEPMLLGVHHGVAYYFNYEKDTSTTLNAAFFAAFASASICGALLRLEGFNSSS